MTKEQGKSSLQSLNSQLTTSSGSSVQETSVDADEACGFPKSVFFIISNEFCERFSYYGMRTVLTLYFINVLMMTDDDAVTAFHAFSMACYFTPLFGAILADSILGRYHTILYISFLYASGSIVLSFASWMETSWLTILGLVMIAVGTGGIKPCVSAFGGDQFGPGRERQLQWFFSLFYLSINAGSLISTFVTPVFRQQVDCSERGDCFPLAFGVPAVLMIIALSLFILGRSHYRRIPPAKGNIILRTFKCIAYAAWKKLYNTFTCTRVNKTHWLDLAEDAFDSKLIDDVKCLTGILLLYIPVPIFWALFDQQASRWTLQANKMNGQFFSTSWFIQPDQIQVINPILIIFMIPLFEYVIYPVLNKMHVCKKPLQRMVIGGLLASSSFVAAGILHQFIESQEPSLPSDHQFSITLINGNINCNLTSLKVQVANETHFRPLPLFMKSEHMIFSGDFVNNDTQNVYLTIDQDNSVANCKIHNHMIQVHNKQAVLLYLDSTGSLVSILPTVFKHHRPEGQSSTLLGLIDTKCHHQVANQSECLIENEHSQQYLLVKSDRHVHKISLFDTLPSDSSLPPRHGFYSSSSPSSLSSSSSSSSIIQLKSTGSVIVENAALGICAKSFAFTPGAVDILIVNCCQVTKVELIPGYGVSMLLQVIQYILITAGEILFSISGLEFSYSHSPLNLRSVVTAAWLLTTAFGNLIVILIAHSSLFALQSIEFYFFAILMAIDIVIFAIMAWRFKPRLMPTAGDSKSEISSQVTTDVPETKHIELIAS